MYINCVTTLKSRDDKFKKLTKRFPNDVITKWEGMDILPQMENGVVISVYEAKIKHGKSSILSNVHSLTN